MTDSPLSRADEFDGQLVRLTLDRPKANIIDAQMVAAIREQVATLREVSSLKLLVFEGAGKHFSFGASVEEHLPDQVASMLQAFHALFRDIEALGVPTAALVRGQCLGGGLELAAFCGRVFAEPSAKLGVPEVKLGVFPPMGALILPWRTGGSYATQLVTQGAAIDADEALAHGLVEQVDDDANLALTTWFETHYAGSSAVGLRHAWQAVRQPVSELLERRLPALERLYLDQLMSHRDPVEGLQAFIERRAPSWSHQ